jgi:2-polyprenyl-3-methyl-5-hydroxy-6-metoxy-1,4-benzoquinol methylase
MHAIASTSERYFAADADADFERERLRLLGQLMNPMTTRRLELLAVGPGWQCLEVGAGDGSVARWLAGRVGPQGHVVATDIDPRFLVGPELADIEVRRHDIVRDVLESGHYDLVHCRALLMHLAEPERALARMAAALRPGGWLLVEEGDMETSAVADPAQPASAMVERVQRLTTEAMQASAGIDIHFGRRCPHLLPRLGLADVGSDRTTWRSRGGDPEARFQQMSLELLWRCAGVISDAEHEELERVYADPSFTFVMAMVGAWGRRPADAS